MDQRWTRKDQAGVDGRHRSLLHDRQEQEDHAREARDHEVRSEGTQARDVQGNEAEVSTLSAQRSPHCGPRRVRRRLPHRRLQPKKRALCERAPLSCGAEAARVRRAPRAASARTPAARRCRCPRPCWHQACRSATSCSADTLVRVQSWRSSSRIVTSLSSTGLLAHAPGPAAASAPAGSCRRRGAASAWRRHALPARAVLRRPGAFSRVELGTAGTRSSRAYLAITS